MQYRSLNSYLTDTSSRLAPGPVALLFLEDNVEVASTLHHHLARGFARIIAFSRPGITLPSDLTHKVDHVIHDMTQDAPVPAAVNRLIDAAPGTWFYYGFNAEYLFHPFCETRTVGEMISFANEERRATILCFVIDLYAENLKAAPNAVSLRDAWMDRAGYYALPRIGAEDEHLDRQMEFYGGLRWRFEEFIPPASRRIDRVALFKACEGLRLGPDHLFNIPEYNTYACPWHHSPTAAIASFRTAKALRHNPGSKRAITRFGWRRSAPFRWTSQELLDLGLMEPGQWF